MRRLAIVAAVLLLTVPLAQAGASPDGDRSSGEAGLEVPDMAYEQIRGSIPGVLSAEGGVPDPLWWDTSNYMLGSTSVQIFFMESTGSGSCGDPDQESWSDTRKAKVLSEIDVGLDWWEDQVPVPGENRLTFHRLDPITVQTCWEPIRHPGPTGDKASNQWAWIRDAMEQVGYDPGEDWCSSTTFDCAAFSATRSFAHDLRNQQGTDWAFSIFVIDSLNDDDGMFADGFFAYAYRNGPFQVLTWDNDGWGIDRMDRVAAHETGHIYGATDEYDNGDAHERSGYFWIQEVHLSDRIMDSSRMDVPPSSGTQGQIGWRDTSPANDRMDPLDTHPEISGLTLPGTPRSDPQAPYEGTGHDLPYPAHTEFLDLGHSEISINDVTEIRWEVDGSQASTSAVSVASPHEAGFAHTLSLSHGEHTVTPVTVNQVGNLAPAPTSHQVTVDTVGPTVELTDPAPGNIYVGGTAQASTPDQAGDDDPRVVGMGYARAQANDDLTAVDRVVFHVDSQVVGIDTTPPYEASWIADPNPGAEKTVTAVAVDEVGNEAEDRQGYVVID